LHYNSHRFLGLLEACYRDENAVLRERLKAATVQALAPVLAAQHGSLQLVDLALLREWLKPDSQPERHAE